MIKNGWFSIEKWILSRFDMAISFDIQSVLFGKYIIRDLYRLNNLVIFTVKQYISPGKYEYNSFLSIQVVRNVIIKGISAKKWKNCIYMLYIKVNCNIFLRKCDDVYLYFIM